MDAPVTASDTDPGEPQAVALVRDLMFSGRIGAEARAAGLKLKIVRDPPKLAELQTHATLLLVDLNLDGATEAAAAWCRQANREAVGFVSHVDASAIAKARELGISQVMARSRFVQVLPVLLRNVAR